MNIRQTKWMIGIVLILMGGGIVLATSLSKSKQYYVTVAELMATPRTYVGKTLKIAGKVSPGSIQQENKKLNWRFQIETGDQQIWVMYRGGLPDSFKEGADVVVTGRFQPSYELQAVNVLAKCASKYEEKLEEDSH